VPMQKTQGACFLFGTLSFPVPKPKAYWEKPLILLRKSKNWRFSFMARIIIAAISLIMVAATIVEAAETVSFKSSIKRLFREPITLTGKLTKPQGNGPFPAVVLLHECSGINKYQDAWAKKLLIWGYVSLQVDSFGPRGYSNICTNSSAIRELAPLRAQDAYDAKSYLAKLNFVDPQRIAVMGWSHGGWTVLNAVTLKLGDPFRASVAFYPYCSEDLNRVNAPLLILIGDKDDWTPAGNCLQMMPRQGRAKSEVILKIYPGAYHGFDWEGKDDNVLGAGLGGGQASFRLLYDPAAAADAIIQVKEFFAKHLK